MWNVLPYTVFDTGTLDGFKGAVNRWLLPRVVFSSVFHYVGACGDAKAIINNFVVLLGPVLLVLIIIMFKTNVHRMLKKIISHISDSIK